MRLFKICICLGCLLLIAAGWSADTRPDPGQVVAYTTWTPNALYLAFRVDDPMVVGNQTLPMGQPWQDDAIAVYLDFSGGAGARLNDNCVRVVISAAGGATVQRGEHGVWRDEPGWFQLSPLGTIRYGVNVQGKLNDLRRSDTGYQVELGLNWQLLRIKPPFRERPNDPLPTIRCAFACYEQGETQAVAYWPDTLTDATLQNPQHWGFLQFEQSMQPVAGKNGVIHAPLMRGNPVIDGKMSGMEWLLAAVTSFPKCWGTTPAPPERGRQSVSQLAAWYNLNPPTGTDAAQPLIPLGPWISAESPLYHTIQLREARRAGVDQLAVALPLDPAQRTQTRHALLALIHALLDCDTASSARMVTDYPLLLPVLNCEQAPATDLTTEAGRAGMLACLQDFYACVPPQYRAMLPGAQGTMCYPIAVTAPGNTVHGTPEDFRAIGTALQPQLDRPVGWILDAGWHADPAHPDLLASGVFDPGSGYTQGQGRVLFSCLAPGVDLPGAAHRSRRGGELYENGWLKTMSARPDLIFLRSWNDFATGTQIAPSRQSGYQTLDATKVGTLRLAAQRGFGVGILQSNLPPVLRPGLTYPVELLLKNGSVEKMATNQGYRINYRITRDDKLLVSGLATEQIVLLELGTARVRFNLATRVGKKKPLEAGAYELYLDFRRNKIPFLNSVLLTEKLGSVRIPFRVAGEGDGAHLLRAGVPSLLTPDIRGTVAYTLRNVDRTTWATGTALQLHWEDASGQALPGEVRLACRGKWAPGTLATFKGAAPATPHEAGWYRLTCTLVRKGSAPQPVHSALVEVAAASVRAQLLNLELRREINGDAVEVPVTLRNAGSVTWTPALTRVQYQWLTWDGQPVPRATGTGALQETVKPGGATLLRLPVDVPAGFGSFRCAFRVMHDGQMATFVTHPTQPVVPVATTLLRSSRMSVLDLKTYMNDWAAHADTVMTRARLDRDGNAFPLEAFLPDATNPTLGYQPGYGGATSHPGMVSFRFAMPQAGRAAMIRAAGQAISLPASPAYALHFVATRVDDEEKPVPFEVRYTDGGVQQASVAVSYWLGTPEHEEPVMLTTPYIQTTRGDDWDLQGSLFVYTIKLDAARVPEKVILPKADGICLFAITLEHPTQREEPGDNR